MNRFAKDRDDLQATNSEVLEGNQVPNRFRDMTRSVETVGGKAPEPGAESAGPAMYDLVEETRRAIQVQSQLILRAIPLLNERIVVERSAGQTDASGNLDLQLYRVPQGMQFVVSRLTVEDATHTPGSPFAAAGAWMALISGDRFGVGSIRDFAPNPPLSNSAFIPWVFSDGNTEAAVFRGGETIGLHLVGTGTLANVDIFCTLQGHEIPI